MPHLRDYMPHSTHTPKRLESRERADYRRVRPVAEGMIQRSVRLIVAEAAKQLVWRRVTRAGHCVRQAVPKDKDLRRL